MNRDENRCKDKGYFDRESRRSEKVYLFNAASGLYEPKSDARQETVERKLPGASKKYPIFTHTNRDWVVTLLGISGLFISVLTLILLVLTVSYARWQWIENKRMADSSVVASGAATSAATTASNQLELTKSEFRADQRPYLTLPEQTNAGAFGVHEGRLRVLLPIQNFGKSPAFHAKYFAKIALGEKQIREMKFNLPARRDLGIIPPGLFPPFPIFSELINGPEDTKKPMIIYGRIDYTDMFPTPKPHYSLYFCQRANVEVTLEVSELERACENHNSIK